jgi:hypothetical protein
MASLRWAVPGKYSKGVILTKSDGTELTIVPERYDYDTDTYAGEGDCIRVPGENDSVKVSDFTFSGNGPPKSILYKRWEDGRWSLRPGGRRYEIGRDDPNEYDTVELAACPAGSQRGGRRRSSRKQRKSRRRLRKSHRAGRR